MKGVFIGIIVFIMIAVATILIREIIVNKELKHRTKCFYLLMFSILAFSFLIDLFLGL